MLDAGTAIGGYRIVGAIGAGAHGVVYRADKDGREVALKVIDEADDARAAALLEAARAAAAVEHGAVARTLAFGRDGERVWIAMERAPGPSLAERLEDGPLPCAEVVGVLVAVCGALDAAHAAGVLHCDLKPQNILVAGGAVKVTDFGLADAGGAPSARYASPEASHGYPVDERSDLYSVGVLAVELLTGSPYEDAGDTPLVLPADVPAPVRAVLIRLLHKDQGARFRNAGAVAAALEAALAGRRLPARSRRGRRVVGVALIAAAALTAILLLRGRSQDASTAATGARTVVVNGAAIEPDVRAAYERRAGAPMAPGRYWYDPTTGAWGLEGGPALGVTLAGLELGRPPVAHELPARLPARAIGAR
jgi:serine/threonine-protein kinase